MCCGSSSHCIGASHKCTLPSVTHFCPKSRHRTLAIGRAGRNHTLCRRRDAKSFSQVCAFGALAHPCTGSPTTGATSKCVSLSCVSILAKVSTPDLGLQAGHSHSLCRQSDAQSISRHLAVASEQTCLCFLPCGSSFHCAGHFYECVSLSCVSILAKVSTPDLGEHSCRSQGYSHAGRATPSHYRASLCLALHFHRPVYALWIVIPLCKNFYECVSLSCVSILKSLDTGLRRALKPVTAIHFAGRATPSL